METIWKQPPDSLGFSKYELTSDGIIRNKTTKRIVKGFMHAGYRRMNLVHDNGKQKSIASHRLLALTFISEQPVGKTNVDHVNNNRSDNQIENLKWVSHSENNKKRIYTTFGRKQKVVQLSRENKFISTFVSIKEAFDKTGVNPSKISAVCAKRQNTAGGYIWVFHHDYFGDLPNEKWKSLTSYEINAEVSNLGRVKLPNNHVTIGTRENNEDTYYRISIASVLYSVHRLVLMAFSPRNDFKDLVVDHIDDDKSNNTLVNLQWLKSSENIEKALNKPVFQYSLDGKYLRSFPSSTKAAKLLKVNRRNISAVCSGTQKSAYNYVWKFAEGNEENKNLDFDYTIKHKRVHQCDMEGKVLKTFSSPTEAAKEIKKFTTNIWAALNGKMKTAYGFKWKYEN